MEPHCIPYAATGRFAPIVLDHLSGAERLREHYRFTPDTAGLRQAAAERSFDPQHRATLVAALEQQYAGMELPEALRSNLQQLARPDALTVTTGHQLVLFGGPLYVPFKIMNVIRLARELSAELQRPVLPVFWMASEDHDRAEVDHTFFHGHKLHWPGSAAGPVGRMLLEGIGPVVEDAIAHLGAGTDAGRYAALLRECYRPTFTLAQATRRFVHALHGEQGLIIVDGDAPALKRLFVPVMREEVLNQVAQRAVQYADQRLAAHYTVQAHAREINLFHLAPGHRRRIVPTTDGFQVLDGGPSFTVDSLLAAIETRPEDFSPNVLLRPVYQETILPNIAYVGGGGELAYWFQLRWLFQALQVPMPVVLLRTSAAFLSRKRLLQANASGLALEDLFGDTDALRARIATANATHRTVLNAERAELAAFYTRVLLASVAADPSLKGAVEARHTAADKGLLRLEKGLVRAAKRTQRTIIDRLDATLEELFPGGGLQERRENILPMLVANGPSYLQHLEALLDPRAGVFTVLVD
jgi:bacillithiol biosynthesis cysteine-adding enzyme BshC